MYICRRIGQWYIPFVLKILLTSIIIRDGVTLWQSCPYGKIKKSYFDLTSIKKHLIVVTSSHIRMHIKGIIWILMEELLIHNSIVSFKFLMISSFYWPLWFVYNNNHIHLYSFWSGKNYVRLNNLSLSRLNSPPGSLLSGFSHFNPYFIFLTRPLFSHLQSYFLSIHINVCRDTETFTITNKLYHPMSA